MGAKGKAKGRAPPRAAHASGEGEAAGSSRPRKRQRAGPAPAEATPAPADRQVAEIVDGLPTIRFAGTPCAPPRNWASPAAGRAAAARAPGADVARLAGKVTLTFEVRAGEGLTVKGVMTRLTARVPPSRRVLRGDAIEDWNKAGEPGVEGRVTVGRLVAAVQRGQLICEQAHGPEWLEALQQLIVPDGPWKMPLVRAVCSHHGPDPNDAAARLDVVVYAYFTRHVRGLRRTRANESLLRLLFELIACEHIKVVMAHLEPSGGVRPIHVRPAHPPTFLSVASSAAEARADFAFTLPGLLKAGEHRGYSECAAPPGLNTDLYPYQRQTLSWMIDQECVPGGLNALFWERRQWVDGLGEEDAWWYFPAAGELRLQAPPLVYGGLLSEQMGLGKTLEVTALILSDKSSGFSRGPEEGSAQNTSTSATRTDISGEVGEDSELASTSTLIVVPVSLLAQWANELKKLTVPGALTVASFHGDAVPTGKESLTRFLADLVAHDVVLTTYKDLEDEGGKRRGKKGKKVLSRVQWRRIVLDECQMVRSSTTSLAQTCQALSARRRWMVSGTPLHSSIADLNGELLFLVCSGYKSKRNAAAQMAELPGESLAVGVPGVWPFSFPDAQDGFWDFKIGQSWKNKQPEALDLLHTLLAGIMMRHTKSQTTLEGNSILALPSITTSLCPVAMTPESVASDPADRHFLYMYKFLEAQATEACELQALLGAGANRRGRVAIAESLWRLLREVCTCAPSTPTLRKAFLKTVDGVLRQLTVGGGGAAGIDGAADGALTNLQEDILSIRTLTAENALRQLMQPRAAQASRHDQQAGLVRDGHARMANYHTNRQYAASSVNEKLAEALGKLHVLEAECAVSAPLARARWAWAGEMICGGGALHWGLSLRHMRRVFERLRAAQELAGEAASNEETEIVVARASPVAARLRGRINEMSAQLATSRGEHSQLLPYVARLQKAVKLGAASIDYTVVEQSGFQGLHDIMEGRPPPNCPICYQMAQEPTVTPCVHIACCECICHWLEAAPLMVPEIRQRRLQDPSAARTAPCPLCRKAFRAVDLLRIKPNEEAEPSQPRGVGADGTASAENKTDTTDRVVPQSEAWSTPTWSPVATEESHTAIGVGDMELLRRDPTVPSLPRQLLSHVHAASALLSPKMKAFLSMLHDSLQEEGGKAKVVVFSQSAVVVNHTTQVLLERGIGAVKIVTAMPEAERKEAVGQFTGSEACRVFVLHAGQAAAGLTLTVARTVFLLEPFLSAGEEAQAMNRCHRIGQTRSVRCVTFYAKDTVEERLLAYRPRERAFAVDTNGRSGAVIESSTRGERAKDNNAGADDTDDALAMLDEGGKVGDAGAPGCSLEKLRYLLGVSSD